MIVDSVITIGFAELSRAEREKLERELTFVTADGKIVTSYLKQPISRQYVIPRGSWYLLPDHVRYTDNRTCPKGKRFKFHVQLDDVEKDKRFAGQTDAIKSMLAEEQGLIVRPPGTGKTQIALGFAAVVGTPTLVLVHTEDILKQWVSYAKKAIPDAHIGIVRGKRCEIGDITIGTIQTLQRYVGNKKFWQQFGAVIADEGHHVSAPTWETVLNASTAKYRFGFTASPTRADGLERTMRFIVGPIIHRQKFSSPIDLKVVPVRTGFNFPYRGPFDWGKLLTALISNDARNKLIARKVRREYEKGNSILVLSRRIEHLERIAAELPDIKTEILHSRRGKERQRIIDELRDGSLRVVLATQLADEALDVQRLNRVFLVHPGKAEGRLIQQVGRSIREHPEKENARIFDFTDRSVGVLRHQWNERKRVYRKNGISIAKRRRLTWRSSA